jgi:hypothetical protein
MSSNRSWIFCWSIIVDFKLMILLFKLTYPVLTAVDDNCLSGYECSIITC